jgi:hypothetical protein
MPAPSWGFLLHGRRRLTHPGDWNVRTLMPDIFLKEQIRKAIC